MFKDSLSSAFSSLVGATNANGLEPFLSLSIFATLKTSGFVETEKTSFKLENSDRTGRITISVGVAAFPQDTRDEEELIQNVDKAMYKAKKRGRNRSAIV